MSVFQFLVNLLIAVIACVLIGWLFSYVAVPLEGLIVVLLCGLAVVATFANNAARSLGVK